MEKAEKIGRPKGRKPDGKEWVNFTLRIRTDLLEGIDVALEKTVGISKTGWILQAIQEKIKRTLAE